MRAHQQQLLLLATAVGLVGCSFSVGGSHWDWIPTSNVKPADSTCEQIIVTGRTVSERFFVHVKLVTPSNNEAARVFQRTVVQEMLPYLRLPDTLTADFAWIPDPTAWRLRGAGSDRAQMGPVRARRPGSKYDETPNGGELDAMVSFDLGRSGRIESANVSFPSQVRGFSDSLLTMVQTANLTNVLPPIPEQLTAPQHFDIRLSVVGWTDTGSVAVDTVRVRFPVYTKSAQGMRMRSPRYPPDAPGIGIHDTVLVSFVVDTNGLVRDRSQRVLYGKHMSFVREARNAMEDALFIPAEYRGCPIAAHTHLPFIFPGR